jgi:hypothetical protein
VESGNFLLLQHLQLCNDLFCISSRLRKIFIPFHSIPFIMPPKLYELLEADEPDWVRILEESTSIEQAKYTHPLTGLTPLHLAVMAKEDTRHTLATSVRVGAIRSLLQSDLGAASVQCHKHGYTPLMYACIVTDMMQLEKEVPVIKILLEYDPDCVRIRSQKSGHAAMDIHIISMSRIKKQAQDGTGAGTPRPPSCTSVVNALTEHDLESSFTTKNCLDLLLACNSLQVMEHVAQEEAHSFTRRLRDRRHQRASRDLLPVPLASRNFHTFWVWEFVLALLKSEHQHTYRSIKPVPPFNALHAACCIPDFPLPFLMLCMRAYPTQMRTPDSINSDLPIHSVAAWNASPNLQHLATNDGIVVVSSEGREDIEIKSAGRNASYLVQHFISDARTKGSKFPCKNTHKKKKKYLPRRHFSPVQGQTHSLSEPTKETEEDRREQNRDDRDSYRD